MKKLKLLLLSLSLIYSTSLLATTLSGNIAIVGHTVNSGPGMSVSPTSLTFNGTAEQLMAADWQEVSFSFTETAQDASSISLSVQASGNFQGILQMDIQQDISYIEITDPTISTTTSAIQYLGSGTVSQDLYNMPSSLMLKVSDAVPASGTISGTLTFIGTYEN